MNDNYLTIIIPIYNASKYLKSCLNSVENQTIPISDLILIDDGSKDNSLEIMETFKRNSKIKNIRIFSNTNHGVSYTRNFGIEKSKTKYIMFLDSDDMLHKDFIKNIYEIENNLSPDFIQVKWKNFIDDTNINSSNTNEIKIYNNNDVFNIQQNLIYNMDRNFSFHRGVLGNIFKLDIINKYNIRFKDNIHMFEDGIFNIMYLEHCNKIVNLKKELYFYRINNSSSLTGKVDVEKLIQNKLCISFLKDFFCSKNIDIKNNKYFNNFCYDSIISYFDAYLFNKKNNSSIKNKKLKFKEIKEEQFYNSVNFVKLKNLNLKGKILYFPIKYKLFYFIYAFYIIKNNFYNTK